MVIHDALNDVNVVELFRWEYESGHLDPLARSHGVWVETYEEALTDGILMLKEKPEVNQFTIKKAFSRGY